MEDTGLFPSQVALLNQWLPGAALVRDHGWGLVETVVLEVFQAGARHIVKAGGERDGHIAREIHAHRHWLDPWTSYRSGAWPTPMATLAPTHGDWQPRNWLVDHDEVRVIDFGRAALRPRMSDFIRLAAQDFLRDPALEAAFVQGYGADPREKRAWHRTKVREAIGTAVWAYRVKDGPFEAQGHQMIADVLGHPRGV